MHTFISVPFTSESGLWKVNGVAKFSSAGIVLEFESKLIGLISNGIKEARIAMDDIFDIKFRKGVFKRGARVEVRTNSIAALNGLPAKDGKVVLKVLPDDFDLARGTVARFQKTLADHTASLPPTHTSVTSLFDEDEDETWELGQKHE